MPRITKEDKAGNRQNIVEAAGRMFRAQGIDSVGIADLMEEAGLIHGGFYNHFASKDDLAAEVCNASFAASLGVLEQVVEEGVDGHVIPQGCGHVIPQAVTVAAVGLRSMRSPMDRPLCSAASSGPCREAARIRIRLLLRGQLRILLRCASPSTSPTSVTSPTPETSRPWRLPPNRLAGTDSSSGTTYCIDNTRGAPLETPGCC